MSDINMIFDLIENQGYDSYRVEIEKFVNSSDPETRSEIARYLCNHINSHAEQQLIQLANDKDYVVKLEALDSLSQFKSDAAYSAIKSFCAHRNPLIRGYSLFGLACTSTHETAEETKEVLISALDAENNAFVKINIRLALYMLGQRVQLLLLLSSYRKCGYRNRCAILNGLNDLLQDGFCDDINLIKEFAYSIQCYEDTAAVTFSLEHLITLIHNYL